MTQKHKLMKLTSNHIFKRDSKCTGNTNAGTSENTVYMQRNSNSLWIRDLEVKYQFSSNIDKNLNTDDFLVLVTKQYFFRILSQLWHLLPHSFPGQGDYWYPPPGPPGMKYGLEINCCCLTRDDSPTHCPLLLSLLQITMKSNNKPAMTWHTWHKCSQVTRARVTYTHTDDPIFIN